MTTDHTDPDHGQETGSNEQSTAPAKSVSRRALLRGATVALPTILTLDSAAAMAANSSHMIGTVSTASRATVNGKVQCLDAASTVGGTWQKLDLGTNPMIHAQYITTRQYYRSNTAGTAGDLTRPVTIENMCSSGGTYWYRDASWLPWKPTKDASYQPIKAGFLVSATALSSFGTAIKVKSYF